MSNSQSTQIAMNNNLVRTSAAKITELRRIATALEAIAKHYDSEFEPYRRAEDSDRTSQQSQ